jgi:glycosyltransferase involved in cell wall biosynthesis
MQTTYHVFLWEPERSPHKLPLFRELMAHPRISSATYIAQGDLNVHRQLEGWQNDFDKDLPIIVGPTPVQIDSIVANSPADSIHIFSGMHWVPCIVNGLRAVIRYGRKFGILHEPRVFEGARGLARLTHSWLTEEPLRRNARFILAIGAHGPRWFRLSGYRPTRIFPFAYFLSNRPDTGASFQIAKTGAIVSFLGRLERLKGADLFLDAIGRVKSPATFYAAGHGTLSSMMEHAERTYACFHYIGPIKMAEVPYFLSNTDILVLPSITMDDGWGAVVSEALLAGAGVVASYKVGASMCLADEVRGTVVLKLTGHEVAAAVDGMIAKDLCAARYRKIRSHWADKHLTQRAGVEYLLNIFDHVFYGRTRPAPFV